MSLAARPSRLNSGATERAVTCPCHSSLATDPSAFPMTTGWRLTNRLYIIYSPIWPLKIKYEIKIDPSCWSYSERFISACFSKEKNICLHNFGLKSNNLLHLWNNFPFQMTSSIPLTFQPLPFNWFWYVISLIHNLILLHILFLSGTICWLELKD